MYVLKVTDHNWFLCFEYWFIADKGDEEDDSEEEMCNDPGDELWLQGFLSALSPGDYQQNSP